VLILIKETTIISRRSFADFSATWLRSRAQSPVEPIKPTPKSILRPVKYTQVERAGRVLLSRMLRRAIKAINRMPTVLVQHSWINPPQMQLLFADGSNSLSKPTAVRGRKAGLRAMLSMV
jgi:hypothetical protein